MEVDEDNQSGPNNSRQTTMRGARACTVCRQAKMKCIGAEDGKRPCHRCERSKSECVFEKHRRGRKPGSKLSEASKMLRLLEKGLSTAKLKSHDLPPPTNSPSLPFQTSRSREELTSHHLDLDLISHPPQGENDSSVNFSDDVRDDENDDVMIPARLISKEKRVSFFRTILNDPDSSNHERNLSLGDAGRYPSTCQATLKSGTVPRALSPPTGYQDPIHMGILTEADCRTLFDLIFLRLNPFINLFDPALHSVSYVRDRSPLLLCTLVAAGCRFWKAEVYDVTRALAQEMAVRAFAEGWKGVEVCQAFACLTYWKEPEESRTWTYIGFACRMAVEIGLNRIASKVLHQESELQRRERRNRERTYLVLWVHDRSLSMQTGRQWMLPENWLVRNSRLWHLEDSGSRRPEDVMVSAFVQLRRIGAETTDVFLDQAGVGHPDINYEVMLQGCNSKLSIWMDHWTDEMKQAGGQLFHISMLSFFRLHVRLFLNTFGLRSSGKESTNIHALSVCYESGLQSLQIVSNDFARLSMLPYSQESVTVMSAYSAVCLLSLLRRIQVLQELRDDNAFEKIYNAITAAAAAFDEAMVPGQTMSSATYHARFLRGLVEKDRLFSLNPVHRRQEPSSYTSESTTSQINYRPNYHIIEKAFGSLASESPPLTNPLVSHSEPGAVLHLRPPSVIAHDLQSPRTLTSDMRGRSAVGEEVRHVNSQPAPSADQVYWRNICTELGMIGAPNISSSVLQDGSWAYSEHSIHYPNHVAT